MSGGWIVSKAVFREPPVFLSSGNCVTDKVAGPRTFYLSLGMLHMAAVSVLWSCDCLSVLRSVHTCNVSAYRNAITLQVTDTIRSYDLNFHPMPHVVTSYKRYTMGFPVCYGSQKHHESKEGERSGRWWRVTLHVQTCSGRNCIIPLLWWPNTDSTLNMPVTLPCNQLLIRYVVTSHPRYHDMM
jgi:hypothetical protein